MERPTESGVTPFLRKVSTKLGRRLWSKRRFLFRGGVKEQCSVLRDDAIEKINARKDAHEIRQLAPRDEEKPPAGSPEGDERLGRCVLDNSVVRKRAVIVGRQTADVHGSPPLLPSEFLAKRSKDRRSSDFGGRGRHRRLELSLLEREQRAFFQDLSYAGGLVARGAGPY